jgi:pimeloyl-ACP methyl ester carboxylesterase
MPLAFIYACNTGSEKPLPTADSTQTTVSIPQRIEFPSSDRLPIAANLYYQKSNKGSFIVLCHMAEFNKSEYREIARKLFNDGYNCMAIDQRSGGETSGYENETKIEADKRELPTGFLDAEKDIVAAVNYVFSTYNQDVVLWGSSYSASLALKVGKANEHVKAIVAFSPGEYFKQDSLVLKNYIRDIGKPVFITSSRDEVNDELISLIDAIGPSTVTHYRPKGHGEHGSMALWDDVPDNLEYWKAVKEFLKKLP